MCWLRRAGRGCARLTGSLRAHTRSVPRDREGRTKMVGLCAKGAMSGFCDVRVAPTGRSDVTGFNCLSGTRGGMALSLHDISLTGAELSRAD